MDSRQVLQLVRSGYAFASPPDLEVLANCPGVEVVSGSWVPRWALEARSALTEAGYPPERLREVFARGHDQVMAELLARARAAGLPRAVEPRLPYTRSPIDQPTELALQRALRQHQKSCLACEALESCAEADDLHEEIELLFPRDRRRHSR